MSLCKYCKLRERPTRKKHCGDESCKAKHNAHKREERKATRIAPVDFLCDKVRPVGVTETEWDNHINNLANHYQMEMARRRALGERI